MMNKKKNSASRILIAIGTLMLATCVVLIILNFRQNSRAEEAVSEQLPKVQEIIDERSSKIGNDPQEKDNSLHNEDSSGEQFDNDTQESSVVMIDGYDYIGCLEIPSVELVMPVMNSYSEAKLNIAPCRYYGSLETSDLVIAGHNFYSGFGKLGSVRQNDEVIFTDMNGNVFVYTVEETELLYPQQVTDMVESDWDLSLYTCNYSGRARVTVRCRLKNTPSGVKYITP